MQPPTENSGGAGGMRSEVRSDAQQISSSASKRLHNEIDARKDDAASQARTVSSAIERAAGDLDKDSPAWIQSAFRQGAEQVRRLADALEQKDSREIVQDLRAMARNNPATFLAGCAALGFAAARVFKAGAEDSESSRSRETPFPPPQGEDPKLRSSSIAPARRSASAGEFA